MNCVNSLDVLNQRNSKLTAAIANYADRIANQALNNPQEIRYLLAQIELQVHNREVVRNKIADTF